MYVVVAYILELNISYEQVIFYLLLEIASIDDGMLVVILLISIPLICFLIRVTPSYLTVSFLGMDALLNFSNNGMDR
jgi:hypothetical protein